MDGMLGDMFITEEELLSGEAGQILSSWEQLPRNCADKLPLPEIARKQGYPIGLKNQGATCYLNSLLQVLFHTPEFRQCILKLPLCIESSDKPSGFVNEGKQSFLLGFQRLFSEMSLCDQKAVGTDYLNKAFKWDQKQHTEQQDIQQAMRVIFDTIIRALFGTQYYETMHSLFRGTTNRYKTCTVCGQTSDRPEQFFDLMLQVKNVKSAGQSLQVLTTAESMDGDNAIFCDTCQCKQDMWLGTRLQQLPATLVLTLNRFDFDYQKFQRVKLNSCFQFQLEFDLSQYLMPNPQPDHHLYELYGVVIHRGSAHGGHYICYVRDLMQETDWEKGLKQTSEQEAKIKGGNVGKINEQEKEDKKEYQLESPKNKKLLQNWYEINDNIATAISANKIASQFQGSQSAYILFYRRKSLPVKNTAIQIPSYFADPIKEANQAMQKERQAYEQQKSQIILTIQGQQHKLKTSMSISDLKQAFIEQGTALVMQSEHNGLPYYPMQIINHPQVQYKEDDTILSLGMPHETRWKKYNMTLPEYQNIKESIGKDRLPMQLLLMVEGQQPKRIITHSDENFLMLRIKIEKLQNIPYEQQIITLVSPYKQTVLTDTLTNDDLLLPKLGIFHTTQLHLKTRANEQEQGQGTKIGKKQNINLICFVIQRDDIIGLKRFYYEKQKTLMDLFRYFLNIQGIKDDHKHRFRNLNGNRLFYTEHYEKKLQELEFSQQLVRFRLERGEIPIKGDMLIKVKNQSSLFKKEGEEQVPEIEKIFDPNTQIKDVKEWACQVYQLQAPLHKLYLTDWVKQPIRSLNREHLTLFEANFGRQDTVCLRDIHSPIGQELVHLEVFSSTTGCPDTATKEGVHIKIEQFKTVKDLKELMISHLQLGQIKPDNLRLREIKRDYMFGSIWRDNNKSVKSVTINSTKVVYQILQKPEQLSDNQIVVVLKKRNKEKRIYEGVTELIFEAGKNPSIQQLTEAVKTQLDMKEDLTLTKYVHHQFQWIELSRKNIELLAKRKKGKQPKKQKGQQQKNNKQKLEENKDKKTQNNQNQNKKQTNKPQKQQERQKKQIQSNQNNQQKKGVQQKENKKNLKGQKEEKQLKNDKKTGKGKGGQNQNQKDLTEECQNLRKAPILLKDGDMIGWGLSEQLKGDDLQTDQDTALRITLKKQPGKVKGGKEKGFKLGVDF